MDYQTIGQFNGTSGSIGDLTAQSPWIYIIAALKSKVLYIGETNDQGGLVARLSRQFGPYTSSTFRQKASSIAGLARVGPPFVVVGARLPHGEESDEFDAASKQIRLLCEAIVHESVATEFLPRNPGWAIVSDPQPSRLSMTDRLVDTCSSIHDCFNHSFEHLRGLAQATPFQLSILDWSRNWADDVGADIGTILESTEVRLCDWLIATLKKEFGESWWTDGVPRPIRVQCASRQEEEGKRDKVPPEAYLTLIDLRVVIQKNWGICSKGIESVSEATGKDRGTSWIVEVNEVRKIWAHPLKQRHTPPDAARLARLRQIRERVVERLRPE